MGNIAYRQLLHNENITFSGQEYTSVNFELDATKESSKVEIPSLNLKISNVTSVLQAYLEEINGALAAHCRITGF